MATPSQKWLYVAVAIVFLGVLGISLAAANVQSSIEETTQESVEQILRPIEGPGSSVEFFEQGIFVVLAAGDLELDDITVTRVEDGGNVSLNPEVGIDDAQVGLRFIVDRRGEYLVEVNRPTVVSISPFGLGAAGGLADAFVNAERAESEAIAENQTLGLVGLAVTLFGLFVALPVAWFRYRNDKRKAQVEAYHRRKAEKHRAHGPRVGE